MITKKPKKQPAVQDMPELTADPYIVNITNHLLAGFSSSSVTIPAT